MSITSIKPIKHTEVDFADQKKAQESFKENERRFTQLQNIFDQITSEHSEEMRKLKKKKMSEEKKTESVENANTKLETIKLQMEKKAALASIGVRVFGYENGPPEIKSPAIFTLIDESSGTQERIYLIVDRIYTTNGTFDGSTEIHTYGIAGGILGRDLPPKFPDKLMYNYWADYCMDQLPVEKRFENWKELVSKFAVLFPRIDLSKRSAEKDLFIMLGGKLFQPLEYITSGGSFASLEPEETDHCKRLSAKFPQFFSEVYIRAIC